MRCTNCGWDNPDENVKCEKCDAPLGGNRSIGNDGGSTILGKTIREPIIEDTIPPKHNRTIIDIPQNAPIPH